MSVIHLDNVSVKRNGKLLLKRLNWSVNKGESWAILGLNGSGKTSLLKLLMAEYFPTEGVITVANFTFGNGDLNPLRKKIGIVSSFISERISPQMIAEKVVLTGKFKSSILYTSYDNKDINEARQMLADLGGEKLIGRPYYSLSQGEKQLLLIARSLMDQPDILILDEATSGLDLFAREQLLQQIERINLLNKKTSVIYVTHHIEEITTNISHVLLLRNGEIIAQGPKNEILVTDVLENFYQDKITLYDIADGRFFIHPFLTQD